VAGARAVAQLLFLSPSLFVCVASGPIGDAELPVTKTHRSQSSTREYRSAGADVFPASSETRAARRPHPKSRTANSLTSGTGGHADELP